MLLAALLGGSSLLAVQRVARLLFAFSVQAHPDVALMADVPTFLFGVALGLVAWAARGRAEVVAAFALAGASVLALVYAEGRRAVLGVGPRWSDLHYLRELGDMMPSIRSASAPVLASIALAAALVTTALWIPRRRTPADPTAPRGRIALLSVAFALISFLAAPAAGHVFAGLLWGGGDDGPRVSLRWPLPAEEIDALLHELGVPPSASEGLPLCRRAAAAPRERTPRSVIVVVVEGLGSETLKRERDGRAVTPFLRKLAAREPTLERFRAAGTKTSRAFPALFAGLPAVPGIRVLHRPALPHLDPMPARWSDAGHHVALLMAAEPAFEHIGTLMKQLGTDEVIGRRLDDDIPPLQWGVDDATLLSRAREWVTARRAATPSPFVFVVNTIATHHPYALPPGAERRFTAGGPAAPEDELFAFLDDAVRDLVTWFDAQERPRGTVLLITGDHVSHRVTAERVARRASPRFDTPLIALNLEEDEAARLRALRDVPTSHLDLAPTISGLLGTQGARCGLGIDLLSGADAAQARLIVSFDDESGDFVTTCAGDEWHSTVDARGLAPAVAVGAASGPGCAARVDAAVAAFIPLLRELMDADRLAPPPEEEVEVIPVATVPAWVALAVGAGATSQQMHEAVAAGIERLAVEVSVTRDGVPVLAAGSRRPGGPDAPWVSELTLDELRDQDAQTRTLAAWLDDAPDSAGIVATVHPARIAELTTTLVYAVTRALRGRAAVVVSAQPLAARVAAGLDGVEAARALPREALNLAELDGLRAEGVRWIALRPTAATPQVVEKISARGLRTLVVEGAGQKPDKDEVAGAGGVVTSDVDFRAR